jgi:hypothetical protein
LLGQCPAVLRLLGLMQSRGKGMTSKFLCADGGHTSQSPQTYFKDQEGFLVVVSGANHRTVPGRVLECKRSSSGLHGHQLTEEVALDRSQ